ncbi:MAG: ATP-dependent DNA helicase RecG [Verrucomicrobiota bacterium]
MQNPASHSPAPDPAWARLTAPLRELEWLPAQKVRQLERFGLATIHDLTTHFPRRYEDRRQFDSFPREESETPVCVCGTVVKTTSKRFGGWKKMFEVTLQEDGAHALSTALVCRWFNVHFVQKLIVTGQRLVVFGKPKRKGKQIVIDHPEFEVVENDAEVSIHLKRITPIYPATEGITPRVLRSWIYRLLQELPPLPSPLPPTLASMPYLEALRAVHFPDGLESLKIARRELVLSEFFDLQLFVAAKRAETISRPGEAHCGPGQLMEAFHRELSFPLTGAQERTIAEIRGDLALPRPMNRLLHGDVGSGKTVVALSAMLLAVEAGFQAALMAPTQILAEQHYLNFKRWLEPLGVRIALRTGSRQEDNALPLFDGSAGGEPQILVGTHALLYEGVQFSQLGLAVIDEQHKFGVLQRAALMNQPIAPDVLVMTATPIPRTLTMTVYGDLDVSTLDELPADRGKIITAARDASKLPDAVEFIKKHLAEGRQAYVVYPLIEESAKLEAKAASAEFEKWKGVFAPHRCELLHGRIDPAEKDAIMERFRKNESQVLVATTVIEVGIDVPNANIMLVENAERFGLAQLHQLRGRVGRGRHKSYCILIHAADTPEAQEKMKTLEATANGFEIAEADLRLRGPGDLLGTAQSGLPPLKLGDLLADAPLMRQARQAAMEIFARDPDLALPEHRRFRMMLAEKRKLTLAQVS